MILQVATSLPAHRVEIVEARQALAVRAMKRGRVVQRVRLLRRHGDPGHGQINVAGPSASSARRLSEKRSRSGESKILLELMSNGAGSDNLATHFKCRNEPGVSERNDEFTLPVVQGASGLAA